MNGTERHLFPGNNTPSGFYSYYQYIFDQKEGSRLYCLKGGPGAGKSTMLRTIGEYFLERGEAVDFFHCSADRDSLDGVLMKERKVALVDGTSPHIMDPENPGAVDCIVNLGECWNESGIRCEKAKILSYHEISSFFFQSAYGYLTGAGAFLSNLMRIQDRCIEEAEYVKIAAEMIGTELSHRQVTDLPGAVKKYFAWAVTPQGIVSEMTSLFRDVRKLYRIEASLGMRVERILAPFAEYAKNRGLALELLYSPFAPEKGLEAIFCPELHLALAVDSPVHHWDVSKIETKPKIITVNLNKKAKASMHGSIEALKQDSQERFFDSLEQGIACLSLAKREHDLLEQCYLPHIDFQKVNGLRDRLIDEIASRYPVGIN